MALVQGIHQKQMKIALNLEPFGFVNATPFFPLPPKYIIEKKEISLNKEVFISFYPVFLP